MSGTENESWPTATIGAAFQTVTGNTPPKREKHFYGSSIPLVKPPELLDGETLDAADGLSEEGRNVARIAPVGSVLVSCIGNLGKIGLAGRELAFNQQINAIFPNQLKANPKFVFYYCLSPLFVEQLEALSSGTTVSIVNKSRFNSIRIPLPPLEKQKRIVAVLDHAFAALDRARTNADANLADAEELFDSWFNAVIDHSRTNWPSKKLPNICENLDKVRVPITKANRKAGDIPYYGASGEVDRVAGHLFDEDLLLISEDGANLLARTYPIAFSISGKSWVNNHAHVLRFDDLTDQEFVRLYLNAIPLDPFISGMAQPKLNQKALNSIPIPFPDRKERARIVCRAEEFAKASAQARNHYEGDLEDIDDLRQSILQKAFAGGLA